MSLPDVVATATTSPLFTSRHRGFADAPGAGFAAFLAFSDSIRSARRTEEMRSDCPPAAARTGLRSAQTRSRDHCLYCLAACRGYPTGPGRISASGRDERLAAVRTPGPAAGQFLLRISGDGCADRSVFLIGRRESLACSQRAGSPPFRSTFISAAVYRAS